MGFFKLLQVQYTQCYDSTANPLDIPVTAILYVNFIHRRASLAWHFDAFLKNALKCIKNVHSAFPHLCCWDLICNSLHCFLPTSLRTFRIFIVLKRYLCLDGLCMCFFSVDLQLALFVLRKQC
jgi:hypothetical protein